jgi:hypothetical protein
MGSRLTYLGDNLELLALAELGLGDGLLETVEGLVVEFLFHRVNNPGPGNLSHQPIEKSNHT